MKPLIVVFAALVASPAYAADPAAMSDADLLTAYKICVSERDANGGTLAGNPTMAITCNPIMTEQSRRVKAASDARRQQSIDALNTILKK